MFFGRPRPSSSRYAEQRCTTSEKPTTRITTGTSEIMMLISRSSMTENPKVHMTAINDTTDDISAGHRRRNISHTAMSRTSATHGKIVRKL